MSKLNSRVLIANTQSTHGLFFTRTNLSVEKIKEELFQENTPSENIITQNYVPGKDGLCDTFLMLERSLVSEYLKKEGVLSIKDFKFTRNTEVPVFSNGLNLFIPVPDKIEGVTGELVKRAIDDVLKKMITFNFLCAGCYTFSPSNTGHFYINFKNVDQRVVRLVKCFLNNFTFNIVDEKDETSSVYIKAHWARSNNDNGNRNKNVREYEANRNEFRGNERNEFRGNGRNEFRGNGRNEFRGNGRNEFRGNGRDEFRGNGRNERNNDKNLNRSNRPDRPHLPARPERNTNNNPNQIQIAKKTEETNETLNV
jgi:hypothetical protein